MKRHRHRISVCLSDRELAIVKSGAECHERSLSEHVRHGLFQGNGIALDAAIRTRGRPKRRPGQPGGQSADGLNGL